MADCLKLTKAMQKTSETLQNVADLYDDHVCHSSLMFHDSILPTPSITGPSKPISYP